MVDFTPILTFSHSNCLAICAFLVPANLVATLTTMVLVALHRPLYQRWQAAFLAMLPALLMVLHVFSWFWVGVVMLQTYILLSLGAVCLGINFWAILHPESMARLLLLLYRTVTRAHRHAGPIEG